MNMNPQMSPAPTPEKVPAQQDEMPDIVTQPIVTEMSIDPSLLEFTIPELEAQAKQITGEATKAQEELSALHQSNPADLDAVREKTNKLNRLNTDFIEVQAAISEKGKGQLTVGKDVFDILPPDEPEARVSNDPIAFRVNGDKGSGTWGGK